MVKHILGAMAVSEAFMADGIDLKIAAIDENSYWMAWTVPTDFWDGNVTRALFIQSYNSENEVLSTFSLDGIKIDSSKSLFAFEPLEDGRILVGWEEISDQSLSHESVFFAPRVATLQVFDPETNSFVGEPSPAIELPSDVYIHEFTASHEGGFFLVTKSPGDGEFVNGDNFAIWQIDATGDANKWDLEIKLRNADIPPGDIDVTVLTSGNLATAWFEY